MNRLEVDYVRRPGAGNCTAIADIPHDLESKVNAEIEESKEGVSRFVLPSRLLDAEGNVVAEAQVHWHVKPWSRVRHRG
jgi:hypothetical protein